MEVSLCFIRCLIVSLSMHTLMFLQTIVVIMPVEVRCFKSVQGLQGHRMFKMFDCFTTLMFLLMVMKTLAKKSKEPTQTTLMFLLMEKACCSWTASAGVHLLRCVWHGRRRTIPSFGINRRYGEHPEFIAVDSDAESEEASASSG